jgi:hypothetical protein
MLPACGTERCQVELRGETTVSLARAPEMVFTAPAPGGDRGPDREGLLLLFCQAFFHPFLSLAGPPLTNWFSHVGWVMTNVDCVLTNGDWVLVNVDWVLERYIINPNLGGWGHL